VFCHGDPITLDILIDNRFKAQFERKTLEAFLYDEAHVDKHRFETLPIDLSTAINNNSLSIISLRFTPPPLSFDNLTSLLAVAIVVDHKIVANAAISVRSLDTKECVRARPDDWKCDKLSFSNQLPINNNDNDDDDDDDDDDDEQLTEFSVAHQSHYCSSCDQASQLCRCVDRQQQFGFDCRLGCARVRHVLSPNNNNNHVYNGQIKLDVNCFCLSVNFFSQLFFFLYSNIV
jgi:hypothetical protein